MSAVTSGSAVTPVNPWRFGAVWTIFFLAFPVAFSGLGLRAVARAGVGFGPLQRVVAPFIVYGVIACGLSVLGVWLWTQPRGLVRC